MKNTVVIRTLSGLSGDMLVSGFFKLSALSQSDLKKCVGRIGLERLKNSVTIKKHYLNHILGWKADVQVRPGQPKRTYADIEHLIKKSFLSAWTKKVSCLTFQLLAKAEAKVHGIKADKVTFHEIGGLDSILDIALAVSLFEKLSADKFVCSPLPVCDGVIHCAHGVLSSPAPAVMHLLKNVPVYGINSQGETVTPTAASLLKALGAKFGPWPRMTIRNSVHVYGSRVLPNVPNGAIFALGSRK